MANKPRKPTTLSSLFAKEKPKKTSKQGRNVDGRFAHGKTPPKPAAALRAIPVLPKLLPPVSQQLAALKASKAAGLRVVLPTVEMLKLKDPRALANAVESAVRKSTSAADRAALTAERSHLEKMFGYKIDWAA